MPPREPIGGLAEGVRPFAHSVSVISNAGSGSPPGVSTRALGASANLPSNGCGGCSTPVVVSSRTARGATRRTPGRISGELGGAVLQGVHSDAGRGPEAGERGRLLRDRPPRRRGALKSAWRPRHPVRVRSQHRLQGCPSTQFSRTANLMGRLRHVSFAGLAEERGRVGLHGAASDGDPLAPKPWAPGGRRRPSFPRAKVRPQTGAGS